MNTAEIASRFIRAAEIDRSPAVGMKEIGERLIRAAEIEERQPRVGPARLRAQQLLYTHTRGDMNGWGIKLGERRSQHPKADACRLHDDDKDAWANQARDFYDIPSMTARDVSEAEEAFGWLMLVGDDDERAALAAWARCMADSKRSFFKDWCTERGISEQTGYRWKRDALVSIHAQLVRCDVQNNDSGPNGVLTGPPEIGYVDDILEPPADEGRTGEHSWAAPDYCRPFEVETIVCPSGNRIVRVPTDQHAFDWARKHNERRRQREKRKRAA